MRNKVLFVFLFCTNSFFGYSQDICSFSIVDTIMVEKAFFVKYKTPLKSDSRLFRNIKFFYLTQNLIPDSFITKEIDKFNMYRPSRKLLNAIMFSKTYLYELPKPHADAVDDFHLLKEESNYSIYEVCSKEGFIHWKINAEDFIKGQPIEEIRYPNLDKCVDVYSPVSNQLIILNKYSDSEK
jgi:hypothetical protein